MMSYEIEPTALKALIDSHAVKVIDGSWALDGSDMHAAFLPDHIKGAQFFDIDAIADKSTHLPHMAPSPQRFAEAVGAMGIAEGDHVVVYDRQGLSSSARVWWTFRLMGHDKVQILRGGLPAWKAAGLPVTAEVATPVVTAYRPHLHNEIVMDLNSLRQILDSRERIVLDARPMARFEGSAPEPRPGLRSGHMPGARSLPSGELIRDGALKPLDELKALFAARSVDEKSAVVTSCGSGVTASILAFALAQLGYPAAAVYDGSWTEWGQARLDTPVITGQA